MLGIGCSVEAVQRRLASLVSIPVGEQILIVNGTPLDPHQTLATYKLPVLTLTPLTRKMPQHASHKMKYMSPKNMPRLEHAGCALIGLHASCPERPRETAASHPEGLPVARHDSDGYS